jgi:hypothetical protein
VAYAIFNKYWQSVTMGHRDEDIVQPGYPVSSVYRAGKWHFGDHYEARYRATAIEVNDHDQTDLQYRYLLKVFLDSDEAYIDAGDLDELELTED